MYSGFAFAFITSMKDWEEVVLSIVLIGLIFTKTIVTWPSQTPLHDDQLMDFNITQSVHMMMPFKANTVMQGQNWKKHRPQDMCVIIPRAVQQWDLMCQLKWVTCNMYKAYKHNVHSGAMDAIIRQIWQENSAGLNSQSPFQMYFKCLELIQRLNAFLWMHSYPICLLVTCSHWHTRCGSAAAQIFKHKL